MHTIRDRITIPRGEGMWLHVPCPLMIESGDVRRCVSGGSSIETVRCSIALAAAVDRYDLGVSYERGRIGRRIFLSS